MKRVDHFAPIPLRFTDAWVAGEIDVVHYAIGGLVAARCYEVRNTADGVATFRLLTIADLCDVSVDTVQRKIEDLGEAGWLGVERPKPGQRIGWRIWLENLRRDDDRFGTSALGTSAPPPHHLRTTSAPDPPSLRRSTSAGTSTEEAANPYEQRDGNASRPPQAETPKPTDETRRDEKRTTNPKPSSRNELDKADGKPEKDDAASLLDRETLVKWAQEDSRRRHERGEP